MMRNKIGKTCAFLLLYPVLMWLQNLRFLLFFSPYMYAKRQEILKLEVPYYVLILFKST